MTRLPEFELLIVGEGPERGQLDALIERLGLRGPRPACWVRDRMTNCRRSTVRPTCWCWLPAAKAGRMCCWKRWLAARRWLPATLGQSRSCSGPRCRCDRRREYAGRDRRGGEPLCRTLPDRTCDQGLCRAVQLGRHDQTASLRCSGHYVVPWTRRPHARTVMILRPSMVEHADGPNPL